jgi:hypothetical protein
MTRKHVADQTPAPEIGPQGPATVDGDIGKERAALPRLPRGVR